MNAAPAARPAVAPVSGAAAPAALPEPPEPFAKPRPGSWTLDAGHCERPVPHFARDIFPEGFARGMREGFAAYGALLDTIEMGVVNGFLYTCVRPLGAPPEPKGLPPRPIFKLVTRLHPGMRRRLKRSEAIWKEKPWREETRRYLEEWMPAIERETERLRAASPAGLDDAALARRLEEARRLLLDDTYTHHRMNCTRLVPVGDFIAHACRWTGASMPEVLEAMRGFSPESRGGLEELRTLTRALEADPEARTAVVRGGDAEAVLSGLEKRRDAVGEAARAWIDRVGHLITGYSPGYPTLRETPATLLEAVRGALAGVGEGAGAEAAEAAGRRALGALRARVAEAHRAEFDALLEEARHVYFLRDHACLRATAAFGVARLAVLEAGRRLVARGLASEPEAALDAAHPELLGLLTEGKGPSRAELDRRLAWRRAATAERVPERLGPPAGAPPPAEWLPSGAARLVRAVDTYLRGMFEEGEGKDKGKGPAAEIVVRGLSASGGRCVGTARLVLEPGDFDRVAPGDVLVARITTPTYNVLLPLLAGIVTDRGGILSHPAIVSREFGIPGVVGAKVATSSIPDGARVEIDGDAGTVRVLP